MKVDLVVATIRIASTMTFGASVDHERRSSRGIVDLNLKLEFITFTDLDSLMSKSTKLMARLYQDYYNSSQGRAP